MDGQGIYPDLRWSDPTRTDAFDDWLRISANPVEIYEICYPETVYVPYRSCQAKLATSIEETLLFHSVSNACSFSADRLKFCTLAGCRFCFNIRTPQKLSSPLIRIKHGPLGSGIYLTPSLEGHVSGRKAEQDIILVSKVLLGKSFKTHRAMPQLRGPPQGYDSIIGLPGRDLKCEEIVISSLDCIRPAFIIVPTRSSKSILPKEKIDNGCDAVGIPQTRSSRLTDPVMRTSLHAHPQVLDSSPSALDVSPDATIPTSIPRDTPWKTEGSRSQILTRIVNLVRLSNEIPRSEREKRVRILQTVFYPEISDHSLHWTPSDLGSPELLDVMQDILDDMDLWPSSNQANPIHSQVRSELARRIYDLTLQCNLIPASLHLTGVICSSTDCVAVGSFGDIYRGVYDSQKVALKRLRVFSSSDESRKDELKAAFMHEALLWRNLCHPYILPFLGIDDHTFKPSLCMILPWMRYGNIRHMIDTLKETKSVTIHTLELQLHRWLLEIGQGLAYLHQENIIHADLRGPNILVDSDWGVRLADFGMAEIKGADSTFNQQGCSAVRWTAPELIDTDDDPQPSFASDMYSFACVMIEVCLERPPEDQMFTLHFR
ncbi:unnamed protein product [Somion occarium]|uniref:Protein kinase domain-containing protein n=1 Tax=Somion occarium TaxID=3059160 RepID=A0ABP1EB27_9APHY